MVKRSGWIAIVVAALAVIGAGLLAFLGLWTWRLLSPPPYPGAIQIRVSRPESYFRFRSGCLQWTLDNTASYTMTQDPSDIIVRLKQSGWMRNYHYNESVRDLASHQWGPAYVVRITEIFVQNQRDGAKLVSTVRTTVSLGGC